MSLVLFMSLALRASLVLLLTLLVLPLLGQMSAALRRLVVLVGLAASLALPLVTAAFPGRPALRVVPTPAAVQIYAEALSPDRAIAAPAARSSSPTAAAGSRALLPTLVISVWLTGVLLVLARLGLGLLRARRLAVRAEPETSAIRVSHDVQAPVVGGLLRPVVLLPATAAQWSEERRQAVLLHELAHVQRRDTMALLVAQIACACYWFQPLVWIALRRLRRECELAADEDVIASGIRPSHYAEHLLAIARSMSVALRWWRDRPSSSSGFGCSSRANGCHRV